VKVLVDMPSGIKELRLWDESGTFRVVFVAKFEEAVYVLHAFQKKTHNIRQGPEIGEATI